MEHKGNSVAALHFYVDAGVDETIGYDSVDQFAENRATTPLQVANVGAHQAAPVLAEQLRPRPPLRRKHRPRSWRQALAI